MGNLHNTMQVNQIANHMVDAFSEHTRAFIQVQNGCDHRCTFCIIPYARGNSRSVPIGAIVTQIKLLLEKGFLEIVFTGVDMTSYGQDLPGKPTFAQMIKRVLALVPELQRLRLSSIDVAEVDEELFELMAYESRLMPCFHISLQSGDNMILKRMKRRHNRQQVIDYCNGLRALRPDVAFGADIIAGFPTEDTTMFENTCRLVFEAGLQFLHVFPYSVRNGTPAARMPQVPMRVRKARAAILRKLGQLQQEVFMARYVDTTQRVLVEANNMGHTDNFIPVVLEGASAGVRVGSVGIFRLTGIQGNRLVAV